MRTRILLGLFALTFGVFANSVLAGDVSECDVLTDPDSEYYAPKLYGLCVAWHNANERARPALATKFINRADFPVPGSPDWPPVSEPSLPAFECPCWFGMEIADICDLGAPSSVASGPINEDEPSLGEYTRVNWTETTEDSMGQPLTVSESFYGETYPNFPICYHTLKEGSEVVYSKQEFMSDAADGVVCKLEADFIASLYNSLNCPAMEP